MKRLASVVVAGTIAGAAVAGMATPASAQQSGPTARAAVEQRYQIGQMERLLEGAVEHGVAIIRDHLQDLAQMPPDMLLSDNAHARGFRLEGYGVFFDVVVPSFETSWTVALRTLDQNDLGLDSAIRTLQSHVKTAGDPDLEQALKRIELQVNPAVLARRSVPANPGARAVTGSAAWSRRPKAPPTIRFWPILTRRTHEVTQALKGHDAGAQQPLGIGPTSG